MSPARAAVASRTLERISAAADLTRDVTTEAISCAAFPAGHVSPELVLVDPKLAVDARARLTDPGDTLERLKVEPLVDRRAVSKSQSNGHAVSAAEPAGIVIRRLAAQGEGASAEDLGARHSRRRFRVAVVAAMLPALAAFILLAYGSWAPSDESSLVSDLAPTATTPPSDGSRATQGSRQSARSAAAKRVETRPHGKAARSAAPRSSRRGAPSPGRRPGTKATRSPLDARRLVWAPVANASRYHVELFDGPSRIFRADTKRPAVVVPASWRLDGRMRRLDPGEYRWYVWPVVAGRRATQAIVQARLAVSR